MQIIPSSNITEYFMEAFGSAKKKTRLDVLPETEFYVVDLLSQFASTENFSQEYKDEPFAIMLKDARENEDERFLLSKRIGDLSGYMCGFFPEKLRKSGNNLKYYMSMGKTGYKMAAKLAGKRRYVFEEMTEKLSGVVDTLNEIRENREIITNT